MFRLRRVPFTATSAPRTSRPPQGLSLARVAFLGILVLLMGAGQYSPQSPGLSQSAAGQPVASTQGQTFEMPLRLIAEARQSYQGIADYSCLFVKKERLRGQLQPDNLIAMKVRTQPFSVYLRWLRPNAMVGQEACYATGRNNGMMRVHPNGFRGVVGFISLEPQDPRALENSRHMITEAGIGNLIERFGQRWQYESRLNRTTIRVGEFEYNKRRCVRVETVHPENPGNAFSFYRSLVYFDRENHLPVRVENYSWPRQGGNPNGELEESYSYVNLHFNAGLSDATFEH